MVNYRKLAASYLKEAADRIDTGTSELSEEEAIELCKVISHRPMSKEKACIYLNLRRSRFDELIRQGIVPKGRKVAGFKELRWYQDELDLCTW